MLPGRRFTARAEIPSPLPLERLVSDPESKFIDNVSPFYFGRPPFSVLSEAGAPVVLSDFRVFPARKLGASDVLARLTSTHMNFNTAKLTQLLSKRPDQSSGALLDVLSLCALPSSALRQALPQHQLLDVVLPAVFQGVGQSAGCVDLYSLETRVAACRVLRQIVQHSQSTYTLDAATQKHTGYETVATALFAALTGALQLWAAADAAEQATKAALSDGVVLTADARLPAAKPSAAHTLGIAQELIDVARILLAKVCEMLLIPMLLT